MQLRSALCALALASMACGAEPDRGGAAHELSADAPPRRAPVTHDAGSMPSKPADAAPSADAAVGDDASVHDADAATDAALAQDDALGPVVVPEGEHCAPVAAWRASWTSFEEEVLALTNEARAAGQDCDSEGKLPPAPALTMEPRLRCAARLHSQYMAQTHDFDHVESANGSDPFVRIANAGYAYAIAGENLAVGQTTARQVVDAWLESDHHCKNLMDPRYTQLGVGYAAGAGKVPGDGGEVDALYWTQSFGASL